MDIMRFLVNESYSMFRPLIFKMTEKDPEVAHEKFIRFAQYLNLEGIDKLLLDEKSNSKKLPFELSNAAGFNKNGDIPPQFLQYLGFDRAVIGTVTADEWGGNPRPRIMRFPSTNSMVNWMGLPGIGAKKVADNLLSFDTSPIPLTINLMSTSGKSGDEILRDLEITVNKTNFIPMVDRYELNISCPNTEHRIEDYLETVGDMLKVVKENARGKEIYVKVSPDMNIVAIRDLVDVCNSLGVKGFTSTNTTTNHDFQYIPVEIGKGGASGDAVRDLSRHIFSSLDSQLYSTGYDMKIIGCGGIDSIEEIKIRYNSDTTSNFCNSHIVSGFQIYTPLVFQGPKLISKIRSGSY